MISYFLLLILFLLIIFTNAIEQYHVGIINHHVQWHIHCSKNHTRIQNPPLNDQPLISYKCPHSSLSIDILPIEIDFTFLCRLQSRLLWVLVDLYQYNLWSWSINVQQLNISIKLNQQIQINEYKYEINNYKNRFIIITAFYIPFESIEILTNKQIEILVQINQCRFYIHNNSTWNDVIDRDCNTFASKTLFVQNAKCDFYSQSILSEINRGPEVQVLDDSTTSIPDFTAFLSINEETTTRLPTDDGRLIPVDYHSLFEEYYGKLLPFLAILTRNSHLQTLIFIFTIIILVLLIIFFIYILCYHYHARLIRKSSLTM